MALRYFRPPKSRQASDKYYQDLARAIGRKNPSVEGVVKAAMQQSIEIWQEIRASEANAQA